MVKIRSRNKFTYRLAHWPIWIAVFFISPGPSIFELFAHGFDRRRALWLALVSGATGIAALRGKLPGVEPAPYIIRFTEDKPNPLYRRICYTFAWNAIVNYALLNLTGLVIAVIADKWYLRQIYYYGYIPIAILIWMLGAAAILPRVRLSTKGEGSERRYFYGSVWAVCMAQPVLGVLWKALPRTHSTDRIKLLVFTGILIVGGVLAFKGMLPRTRRIVPGEAVVAD